VKDCAALESEHDRICVMIPEEHARLRRMLLSMIGKERED